MFSGYCRELRQKRNDFIGFKSRLAAMYTTDALIGSKRSEGHLHFSESFKRRARARWMEKSRKFIRVSGSGQGATQTGIDKETHTHTHERLKKKTKRKVVELDLHLPVCAWAWWAAGSARSSCSKVHKRCTGNDRCRPAATGESKSLRSWRTRGPL